MPAAIGRLASPERAEHGQHLARVDDEERGDEDRCRRQEPAELLPLLRPCGAISDEHGHHCEQEREHCPEPRPIAAGKQRELDLDGLVCPGNARQRARPEGGSQPHYEQRGSGEPGDGTESWGGQLPGRKQQEEKRSERERGDRSQIRRQPRPGAARQRARRLSKCVDRVLLAEQCDLNSESRREEDPADPVPEPARHDQGADGRVGEDRDDEGRVGRPREVRDLE